MRTTPMHMRQCLTAALMSCALFHTSPASAQDDAVTRANRLAYDSTLKCFVADGYASDERRKAGDAVKSAAYKAKARESFDLAYAAGEKIGLTDQKIGRDLDFAQETELPQFIRDQRYLLDTAATCKALGLM
jgi:hypothetical protein